MLLPKLLAAQATRVLLRLHATLHATLHHVDKSAPQLRPPASRSSFTEPAFRLLIMLALTWNH